MFLLLISLSLSIPEIELEWRFVLMCCIGRSRCSQSKRNHCNQWKKSLLMYSGKVGFWGNISGHCQFLSLFFSFFLSFQIIKLISFIDKSKKISNYRMWKYNESTFRQANTIHFATIFKNFFNALQGTKHPYKYNELFSSMCPSLRSIYCYVILRHMPSLALSTDGCTAIHFRPGTNIIIYKRHNKQCWTQTRRWYFKRIRWHILRQRFRRKKMILGNYFRRRRKQQQWCQQ